MIITVPLSQNQTTIIDDQFAKLLIYKWYAHWDEDVKSYYARGVIPKNGNRKIVALSRIIMSIYLDRELLRTEYVDHINHDTLDNRLENLVVKTARGNQLNTQKRRDNTSGYKGVGWRKNKRKWVAYITVNNKQIHLGYFTNNFDAALAYDKAYIQYGGNDSVPYGMNFPENYEVLKKEGQKT